MIKPVKDWMIIEKVEDIDSLIAIPDSYETKVDETTVYKVLSIGPGWKENGKLQEMPANPGDEVIMEGLNVVNFKYKDKRYFAARGRDVAFVVEGD